MEIKNNLHTVDPYTRARIDASGNKKAPAKTAPVPAGTGDRVSVSPEARIQAEILSTAASTPEIRAELVAALKAKVDSGEYIVDAKKTARKMLEQEPGLFRA
jgi:flagellar biosynthesis anti-sigma factor FlgM